MKVVHITRDFGEASGVATFVRELVASAEGLGGGECENVEVSRTNIQYQWGERKVGKWVDLVHIHGLWLKEYHEAAKWARERGIPVVWSTHGMTAPWSMRHKWWKKLPAWWLYQRRDLRGAAAIHCTTEQEVEWNKRLGLENCFVAPLGTRETGVGSEGLGVSGGKVVLFVGRIYPVKGLPNLIRAWAMVMHGKSAGWKLRLVGPDQAGHRAELEALVKELGVEESVEFAGAKYGEELSREYDKCAVLALPSFTENFGATVIDALAHGKPCIASTFTPWKELEERGCGWWVSNEPEELAKAIREAMEKSGEELKAMGERGRKLVEEKYTWEAVAETMVKKYEEVIRCCRN